ncbi:MAG TPA: dipicolinate synthase subunit DpsA [Candidatus Dormibacteraeota bacterium]|nr:dipicolinate synthase subunit DpsA [Candidatus Dormibacteraeota bacterium]
MRRYRVAVLGGDGREVHIAERLAHDGHEAVRYGQASGEPNGVRVAIELPDAVAGAEWLILPSPGLDGDVVYAPDAPEPIVLGRGLLERSALSTGGIVLGRSNPTLDTLASAMDVNLFQLKDDLGLATRLSTGVAEGVIRLLIELTKRILREHRIVVVGYGVTGAVILDYLVAARCAPVVTTRHPKALERARQCGAIPVAYEERVAAMGEADIIVNTVPSIDAVPRNAFAALRDRIVVDIASPPGGIDHEAARAAGVRVHWPRGLAGGRAPLTAGDAQYAFVARAMASRDPVPMPAAISRGDQI